MLLIGFFLADGYVVPLGILGSIQTMNLSLGGIDIPYRWVVIACLCVLFYAIWRLAQLDRTGKSMAVIQIDAARYLYDKAAEERQKPEPQYDLVNKLLGQAAKVAHDVSPYLYPTQQAIKHGGEEDAAPIRMESLSEYQLEKLIARLRG